MGFYHILILLGVIPYEYVWGGRLNEANYIQHEVSSLVITLLSLVIVVLKFYNDSAKWLTRSAYVVGSIFVISGFANLLAHSYLEMIFGSLFAFAIGLNTLYLAWSSQD